MGHIDPTKDVFAQFRENDRPGPIHMLNLVRLRKEAAYPDGDKDSSFNTYGYGTAQLLVYVLQQCGDNLTRENVMKQAASLKDVTGDLSLPGIKANTSPTDYRVNKSLQMMRFNGERWELFGPILEDAAPAG